MGKTKTVYHKILSILKSRYFFAAFCIVLEFAQIMLVFSVLYKYFFPITVAGKIFYVGVLLYMINRDETPEFRSYSDTELRRLNAHITNLDVQISRCMVIHQMLGTRISDTLTLKKDCLSKRNGLDMIRIDQVKTRIYEKPISAELAELIQKAIDYTEERYGETEYVFVDEKDIKRLLQYTTVKHYRKISNQTLADETRKARNQQTRILLANLDGWGERISVPQLVKMTGSSREFFYKNPVVRKEIDRAMEQKAGTINPRREILEKAEVIFIGCKSETNRSQRV